MLISKIVSSHQRMKSLVALTKDEDRLASLKRQLEQAKKTGGDKSYEKELEDEIENIERERTSQDKTKDSEIDWKKILVTDAGTDYYTAITSLARISNNPRAGKKELMNKLMPIMKANKVDFDVEKYEQAWREFSKASVPRGAYDVKDSLRYSITCNVSGGVTGNRTSLLKENGQVKYFNNENEAKEEARKLTEKMNNENSRAHFSYFVTPTRDSKVKDENPKVKALEKELDGIRFDISAVEQKLQQYERSDETGNKEYWKMHEKLKMLLKKEQDIRGKWQSITKDSKGKWHLEDDNEKIVSKEFDTEVEAKAEVMRRRKEAQTKGTKLIDVTIVQDSDYRGYKTTDQIIKGFMIYKSGKANMFTAKNENGQQYEGTIEDIKKKIDAYWVKQDETVMKQKVNDAYEYLPIDERIALIKKDIEKSKKDGLMNILEVWERALIKAEAEKKGTVAKPCRACGGKNIGLKGTKCRTCGGRVGDSKTKDEKSSFGTKQYTMAELLKKAKQGELELYGDPKPRQHVQVRFPNGKTEMVWVEDSKTKYKNISPRWKTKDDKIFKLKKDTQTKDAVNNDVITETMYEIKNGKDPNKAFAEVLEDQNYYGPRAKQDRIDMANALRSKGVNIDITTVERLLGIR